MTAERAADALGIDVVDAGPGRATVRMVVSHSMLNGLDVCHGGIVFTLADTAMAHASNGDGRRAVAAAASIDFVDPAHEGDELVAVAVEVHRRGRTGLYDVVVSRGDSTVIARFHGRTQDVRAQA